MIELLAAAALSAPCTPPEGAAVRARSSEAVVYVHRSRLWGCTSRGHLRLRPAEHVVGLALARTRVAIVEGSGGRRAFSRISLRVVRLPSRRTEAEAAIAFPYRTYGRIVRMRLHASGALAYAVAGATERGIHLLNRHGGFSLDRRPAADLRSLELDGDRFRWHWRGERLQARAGSRPAGPPARCVPPPGAIVLAEGEASMFTLRVTRGRNDSQAATYGCLAGGRPLLLAEGGAGEDEEGSPTQQEVRLAALRPPYAALDFEDDYDKGGDEHVQVHDLRDGLPGAIGCRRSWYYTDPDGAELVRVLLSPTGRLACSLRHSHDGKVVSSSIESTGGGEERVEIDRGPEVDAGSLQAEGSTLVWTRGGARRTAAFP